MDEGATSSSGCQNNIATSADLVGSQGWYKVSTELKRSIFVYTTTVPITNITGLDNTKYETLTGNKGFASLEYEQDRERLPLNNNAVLYEDDLEIAPGSGLNLNGRIFTNGNLLTRQPYTTVRFYLVSSPKSCYFNEQNSKIVVAGNVIDSRVNETSQGGSPQVDYLINLIHLQAQFDMTISATQIRLYLNPFTGLQQLIMMQHIPKELTV